MKAVKRDYDAYFLQEKVQIEQQKFFLCRKKNRYLQYSRESKI